MLSSSLKKSLFSSGHVPRSVQINMILGPNRTSCVNVYKYISPKMRAVRFQAWNEASIRIISTYFAYGNFASTKPYSIAQLLSATTIVFFPKLTLASSSFGK
uniref:Uncharacterized protein n=1 Tax=Cucumis melo TaxID=3656 RepID=A0A9I9ELP8_CUCME